MKDFRVFVEKPIGKSLTLFYVFSATRWGGVKLLTLSPCWENIFLTSKNFWKSFFQYMIWFSLTKYWSTLSMVKMIFLIKRSFFCKKYENEIINGKSTFFWSGFFVSFWKPNSQNLNFWNIVKITENFTFFYTFPFSYIWCFWQKFHVFKKKNSNFNFSKYW